MALHLHHHHPVTAATRRAAQGLRLARHIERRAERHWPFVAYTALTLATAGYVIAQLARIA